MEHRYLGRSGFRVPVLALGTGTFAGTSEFFRHWGQTDVAEARRLVDICLEHGVCMFDSADIYSSGGAESVLGEAIKGRPRDKLIISTKATFRFGEGENEVGSSRYHLLRSVEGSLRRLGTDYIDVLQLHWPDPTTPIHETMEAFATLVNQGKVRAVGVSNYSVAQMAEAELTVGIVSNQVPYSMVNRGIEADVIPYCLEHGKAVLAYSPLQRGLLTGKFSPDHTFAPTDHRGRNEYFTPENIRRVNGFLGTLRDLAEDHDATLAQLVIAWTLAQPGITAALVGARDAEQALANARGGEIQLDPAEVELINKRLGSLVLEGV